MDLKVSMMKNGEAFRDLFIVALRMFRYRSNTELDVWSKVWIAVFVRIAFLRIGWHNSRDGGLE